MGLVKRVLSYWDPDISPEDIAFIDSFLNEPARFLFYQMNRLDQFHALSVARTIHEQAANLTPYEKTLAVKAALLHDIGKVEGDFGFWSRILVGLIRRIMPKLRGRLAFHQRRTFWGRLRYSFYVDLVHPARGAHMAKIFGVETTVVEMIRRHHEPAPRADANSPLGWLQLADNRN